MATVVPRDLLKNKEIPALFKRVNYTANVSSIKGLPIREYDMRNAGMSMIKRYKLLPDKAIAKLEALSKYDMNVAVGKLRKEMPDFSTDLSNAIRTSMIAFLVKNKIEESDILAIKNDAVFIASHSKPTITEINGATFLNKHSYTSFLKIDNMECYYNSSTNILDVKGIGSSVLESGKGVLSVIAKIMSDKESLSQDDFNREIIKFRRDYIHGKLDVEVYREFIGNGKFRQLNGGFEVTKGMHILSYLNEASNEIVDQIDKRYNYIKVVVPLLQSIM